MPLPSVSAGTVTTRIWEGDHELVENLNDLETSFWALLRGEDPISQRSLKALKHFLTLHPLSLPVVDVRIRSLEDTSLLKVAILPQLRVYYKGYERFRHRGVVNGEILSEVYERSLRF